MFFHSTKLPLKLFSILLKVLSAYCFVKSQKQTFVKIPEFFPGDVVKVGVRITEGKKDRIQYFEGVCIAKKSRDLTSA